MWLFWYTSGNYEYRVYIYEKNIVIHLSVDCFSWSFQRKNKYSNKWLITISLWNTTMQTNNLYTVLLILNIKWIFTNFGGKISGLIFFHIFNTNFPGSWFLLGWNIPDLLMSTSRFSASFQGSGNKDKMWLSSRNENYRVQ